MVTTENYEEYLMLAADGELAPDALEALQAFLAEHPELEAEAGIWQALRLAPDPAIAFEEKASLLRREPRVIPLGWKTIGITAAAALVLMLIVSRETVTVPDLLPGAGTLAVKSVIPITPVQPDVALPAVASGEQAQTRHRSGNRHVKLSPVKSPPLPQAQPLPQLAIIEDAAVIPSLSMPPAPAAFTMDEPAAPAPVTASTFYPRVHLRPQNEEALALLKRGLDDRMTKAKEVARSLKATALRFQVSGNQLHINL